MYRNYAKLPYRPSVGLMILNDDNKIFIGKRIGMKEGGWQMPQGGIDLGETPTEAVRREMLEEIGCNKGTIISEAKRWYSYNLPSFLIPKLWDGKFRGQVQKWFLIKFEGKDSDISLKNNKEPEFSEWRWSTASDLLVLITPFKYKLYKLVINELYYGFVNKK